MRSRHAVRWIALAVGAVVVAFSVVLALNVTTSPTTNPHALMIGRRPQLQLTTLDGEAIAASELRGKSVIVNFWNTWCIPCEQELPSLVSFYEAHRDDADLVFVGILRDDEPAAARAFVKEEQLGWLTALDPGAKAALTFGTTGQPETFALAPDGRVVAQQISPVSRADLETMLSIARSA